jgi:hypothetical protein
MLRFRAFVQFGFERARAKPADGILRGAQALGNP